MWALFKSKVISILKGELIKLALKKILGSALAGGFKGWLIRFIAEYLFDEIAQPLLHYLFNEVKYQANVIDGKLIVKKLEKARTDGDKKVYDDTTDRALD